MKRAFVITATILFAVSACAPQTMSTPGSFSPEKDLCDWFNKSLIIRTERIPGILIIQNVADKYSKVEFDFYNIAMMKDYINAIEEYIDVNDKFIEGWKKLGIHPLARDYWENELQAVETYNEGYSLSLRGFNEQKENLIQEGSEIYEIGNIASKKAEGLMIDLRTKCR